MLALALVALGQYIALQDEGVTVGTQLRRINCSGAGVTCTASGTTGTISVSAGGGGGAPTEAQYWVGAADGTLSAEKNLGTLGTGIIISTDGVPSKYNGTTCTNQFPRSLSAVGAAVCESVADADLASNYSGVGACGVNQWVSTLNDNAAPVCTQPAFSNISGTVAASQLPNPSAGALGGVRSLTCGGTDKLSAIGTDGVPVCSADVSGGGGGTSPFIRILGSL